MAIQTIDVTVPGGDTPRSANIKINNNFSNTTHAASHLVGTSAGQIPLAEQVFLAAFSRMQNINNAPQPYDCDTLPVGSRFFLENNALHGPSADIPSVGAYWVVDTISSQPGTSTVLTQIAYNNQNGLIVSRAKFGSWTPWQVAGTTPLTYTKTTAAGANVVVDTAGRLSRSTSSERYKDILAPLVLDDVKYADAMALQPIVYRSTADADNPAYHYYSFSAEELGAYDPAFTLWRETETVTDEDGITTEQPLAERQAEGININALLAMNHAIAIKQDGLIKELQTQVGNLQSEVATLQTTNNP